MTPESRLLQASLSAAAALAPALLGFRPMNQQEQRTAALFSIRRFTGKEAPESLCTSTQAGLRAKL